MFERIDHVEIIPSNLEKTIRFYTDLLGFKVKERTKTKGPLEETVYLALDGSVIELLAPRETAPRSTVKWQVGYRMVALEVRDMDKAVQYLKSKGVEISWRPKSVGKSTRAEIKDPDGIPIELREW